MEYSIPLPEAAQECNCATELGEMLLTSLKFRKHMT